MRVTYKQLVKVLKETPPKHLPVTLKYIFSFKENIDTFGYYIFPKAIPTKTPKFHYEIYDFLFAPGNGALAAPRGFAKSTIVGLIFLSWVIVNNYKKYIVYMSQNHVKTEQFIEPIGDAFKHNTRLQFIYGDLTPSNVRDRMSGKDRQDMIDINGIRLQAVSFTKNIRGFIHDSGRPDLIIGDDIDDDERVLNPELRFKDRNKLTKQVLPSLSINGQFKMIGTILHYDSLLRTRIRRYNGKIYTACSIKENGDIDKDTLLWPGYWNVERLQKTRDDIGSVSFSSEYLNNPIANAKGLIPREIITKCLDKTLSYKEAVMLKYEEKKQGCDFAFSDRITADQSAYVCVGKSAGGKYTLFDIKTYKGLSITEQFNILDDRDKLYKLDETVMEENSIRSMTRELYRWNFDYHLIWTGSSDPADSLKPSSEFEGKRHSVGKKSMIIRLSALFENESFRIPYKTDEDKQITDTLINELLTFALNDGKLVEVGVHADIPIALAMCMERMSNDNEDGIILW